MKDMEIDRKCAPCKDGRGRHHATMLRPTLVVLLLSAGSAHAGEFHFDPIAADPTVFSLDEEADAADPTDELAAPRAHLAADAFNYEPYVIGASDFNGVTLVAGGVCWNWFVADRVSAGVFAEAMNVNQVGENAFGVGVGVSMRWHFIQSEKFSLFGEIGVGVCVFDSPVPIDATSVNFTPRAAIGANFAIDATTELSTRIGWLHISNAQTGEQNPGVDTLAFALGLQFAF